MSEETKKIGAFQASVARTPKEIRESRGADINEDGALVYKRAVEDLEYTYKKLIRERNQLRDISPNNALSFIAAKEFDPKGFQEKDFELSMQIRSALIKLQVAQTRFTFLFEDGEAIQDAPIEEMKGE